MTSILASRINKTPTALPIPPFLQPPAPLPSPILPASQDESFSVSSLRDLLTIGLEEKTERERKEEEDDRAVELAEGELEEEEEEDEEDDEDGDEEDEDDEDAQGADGDFSRLKNRGGEAKGRRGREDDDARSCKENSAAIHKQNLLKKIVCACTTHTRRQMDREVEIYRENGTS